MYAHGTMESSDPQPALVRCVRAHAQGPEHADGGFTVVHEGLAWRARFADGSSARFGMNARYPEPASPTLVPAKEDRGFREAAGAPLAAARPMRIVLRVETPEDQAHKDRGINREVQTGDARSTLGAPGSWRFAKATKRPAPRVQKMVDANGPRNQRRPTVGAVKHPPVFPLAPPR